MATDRINLLDYNRSRLESLFEEWGERSFRASQILKWVYHEQTDDFGAMTNLSKVLRERLGGVAEVRMPQVEHHQVSSDGTRKWLLRVDARNCIETVYIPEPGRGTLCISSQVGCALNCRFCATAEQGFNRNLTTAEIIGQLRIATQWLRRTGRGDERVTNVVLMGMGEPLLNFDAVTCAMDLMLDDLAFGLARRRVTLSTAGLAPGILALARRCPVSLAISLHAPNDELRNRLVPLNKKYPIRELLDACRAYVAHSPKGSITFEYVMLAGINDSLAHARELVALLRGLPSKVNLIPFNSYPGTSFERSSDGTIDRFRDVLMEAGLIAITRKTRGEDIDAACGQLAGRVLPRSSRIARQRGVPAATRHAGVL
jgi:23S rRNA (adenine2503-C2)-methyltransferase